LHNHYATIAAKEKVTAEDEAIRLIAHAADGSVRDGLSLLDQAIARSEGKIVTADVKEMLGLADRSESLALGQHLLRGQMKEALAAFDRLVLSGADPLQILQDTADLVHLLTRAQIVPDFAATADLAEMDKAILTELADIKIPALTRAWQILLKGIAEIQTAPHPAVAAEMVLIRLAYASELPPPGDLIRLLREKMKDGSGSSAAPQGPSKGPEAVRRGAVLATVVPMAQPAPSISMEPQPQSFTEVVALFENHREGALTAELRASVHLVRFAIGRIEVRLESFATPDLVGKVGAKLLEWTGLRWVISVSSETGEPSLIEKDREAERLRMERIQAHPLMATTLRVFSGAKIVSIRAKVASENSSAQDAAESESPEIEE
jgi:DNA polymerase-3 subunit gamma/tau